MKELNEKLDFSKEPLKLELGMDLLSVVINPKTKEKFLSGIKKIRISIMERRAAEIPEIHIEDNLDIEPLSCRLLAYGKEIMKVRLYGWMGSACEAILESLNRNLEENYFYFKEDFRINAEKLEEMLHEQSREAYQFLYRYYTNIEPDKKQAFHWLKKMSYYGVSRDLRRLLHCYFNGEGCEKDEIQGGKIQRLLNPDSPGRRRF